MKKTILIFITLITCQSYAQNFPELSPDFGKKTYEHVKKLYEFGTRNPGSVAEGNTIEYLREQFSQIPMKVEIDTFYFNGLNMENRQIVLNGKNIPVQTCYLNASFQDTMNLSAECYVIDAPLSTALDIKNKIVLSNESNQVILLKEYDPKAILVFNKDIFPELVQYHKKTVEIQIPTETNHEPKISYNVIASYQRSTGKNQDIIITAHWDSQKGPGADDNASGTAVLIELARYFRPYADNFAYNLKFVALGAEEVGLIGSKAYILKY